MVLSLRLSALLLLSPSFLLAQPLFEVSGAQKSSADLPPQLQQQIFEVQNEAYERTRMLVEQSLVEQHIEAEMKKSNQTKEKVMEKLFTVTEPKEGDLKTWYEKNKERVPYPFDQVKGEIKKFLQNEQREKKRQDLVKKLSDEKKFRLLAQKPEAPVLPVNTAGFPSKGADKAPVTIVEFADYQCPHCKQAKTPLFDALKKHKNKARLVFIDYPVNPSGVSRLVAQAAFCARKKKEDKYWEFHSLAFDKQKDLSNESPAQLAKAVGLKEDEIKACATSAEAIEYVNKGKAEGDKIGVTGTPFILINGKRYTGPHTTEDFAKAIETAAK